jgi:ferredoxin
MYLVNSERCAGCGLCAGACPREAIRVAEGKAQIDPALCVGCGMCARMCPEGAIGLAVPAGVTAYRRGRDSSPPLRQQLRNLRTQTRTLEGEWEQFMERLEGLEQRLR